MPIFGTHVLYREAGRPEVKRKSFTENDHSIQAYIFVKALSEEKSLDFHEFHPFQLLEDSRNAA
jgi:hypothetical protein